jgi:hypothetical protein
MKIVYHDFPGKDSKKHDFFRFFAGLQVTYQYGIISKTVFQEASFL